MIGIIERSFECVDNFKFITLYKRLVRNHLEYAGSIWSPCKKELIELIEKFKKRATKTLPNLQYLS